MPTLNPLMLLRMLHILAAAALIGAIIFNYFIVRRSLRLIPPAHAVVIGQRVGNLFMWLGWIALVILGLTGAVRLLLDGRLNLVFTAWIYETSAGRALLLMILAWLVTVSSAAVMTWILRPVLVAKLSVQSNPDLAAVEKRRAAQMSANLWLERMQLVNLVFSTLAAIGGSSVMYGGIL